MTAPSTSSHPPLPKFKVVAANTSEGYLKASRLLDANKTLNLETRANLKSEWILYPKDLKTADFLRNTKDITLMELKPEEKLSKAIVIGYPLSLPTDRLTTLANIQTAQRMTTKDKIDSRAVLCTFTGPIPGHVDLGAFGRFQTRTYYPEPLRCYNCQRFDHHKTQCKAPHRCAICSGNHNTDICIQKHKQGETTTAKCPNCGQNHHAWYKRCPARIQRIQDSTPAPPTTSRNVRPPTMEKTNKPEPQQPQPQPASTTRRPTIQIRPPQQAPRNHVTFNQIENMVKDYTIQVLSGYNWISYSETTNNLHEVVNNFIRSVWQCVSASPSLSHSQHLTTTSSPSSSSSQPSFSSFSAVVAAAPPAASSSASSSSALTSSSSSSSSRPAPPATSSSFSCCLLSAVLLLATFSSSSSAALPAASSFCLLPPVRNLALTQNSFTSS